MATYTGSDKRLGYLFQNGGGGGGGSSTLAGLSDVSLSSPTDGQVLKYDANNQEWVNANESGGGGGGSSTLGGLSDVNLTTPTDGQVLVYNGTSGKWENASGGASGHTYSTTEQVVGTWIDGKPIYEKTVDLGYLPNSGAAYINHGISNINTVISLQGIAQNGTGVTIPLPLVSTTPSYCVQLSSNTTQIFTITGSDRSVYYAYAIIRYTKSTD